MFRSSSICVLLFLTAPLQAGPWGESLFEESTRDFGAAPRGQLLTHPFRIVNNTKGPITIASARVSCGCVSTQIFKNNLSPGEDTILLANMDTRRFVGPKAVTIYVQITQPKFEEVRLTVQANSREDVSFAPEALAFGKVSKGDTKKASVLISFTGATKIIDTKSESNFIQASVKPGPAPHSFLLEATLRSDTPVGLWYTDIWLQTNNPNIPKLRVPVNVEVATALQVTPNRVQLGQVKAGTETDRKIVLRGAGPFRILSINGVDGQIAVQPASNESKNIHILTLTLRPSQVGEISRTIEVRTDMKNNEQIQFDARADVIP